MLCVHPASLCSSKRLKDIDDPKKFAKSLQDFFDKNERSKYFANLTWILSQQI